VSCGVIQQHDGYALDEGLAQHVEDVELREHCVVVVEGTQEDDVRAADQVDREEASDVDVVSAVLEFSPMKGEGGERVFHIYVNVHIHTYMHTDTCMTRKRKRATEREKEGERGTGVREREGGRERDTDIDTDVKVEIMDR